MTAAENHIDEALDSVLKAPGSGWIPAMLIVLAGVNLYRALATN